ncbi:MAG: type II toxin-antitoxin system VapC family toxin [Pleurocapsa sp. CRU_1_2]|nr:type II toxin-antitoxin system VapC family toxin [Pseudanabaena sp. SU_2_4]NJO96206.1 type II toxin-antitoxin system VapC family toxin [Pleurocapsa sp. CRU_1_2]
MTVVLDASALLAYLQDEPGGDRIEEVLAESVISSVNWAEVIQKSIAAGVEVDGMLDDLQALGMGVEPFTPEDGEMAGRLWEQTRQAGLSLGDRACLSLGLRLGVTVLTSDRAWATLNLSLDVRVIR